MIIVIMLILTFFLFLVSSNSGNVCVGGGENPKSAMYFSEGGFITDCMNIAGYSYIHRYIAFELVGNSVN